VINVGSKERLLPRCNPQCLHQSVPLDFAGYVAKLYPQRIAQMTSTEPVHGECYEARKRLKEAEALKERQPLKVHPLLLSLLKLSSSW